MTAGDGALPGAHDRGEYVVGGARSGCPLGGADVEGVVLNGRAVGLFAVHDHHVDGRWCHRYTKNDVHFPSNIVAAAVRHPDARPTAHTQRYSSIVKIGPRDQEILTRGSIHAQRLRHVIPTTCRRRGELMMSISEKLSGGTDYLRSSGLDPGGRQESAKSLIGVWCQAGETARQPRRKWPRQ